MYKSNSISTSFGRFLEGDEFGLVTILKSEFPAGLTQTKPKILSGVGRVQAGKPGSRVNWVKAFSLARAGWVKPG
jgi:hypothetical protein